MKTYKIKNWAKLYENAGTRKLKYLQWIPIPNNLDGYNVRRIASHPNGTEIFCAWILMLQVASKGDVHRRGHLKNEETSFDSGHLSVITGFKKEIFDLAIPVLVNYGWLEVYGDSPNALAESPNALGESPNVRNGIEENRIEENIKPHGSQASVDAIEQIVRGRFVHSMSAKDNSPEYCGIRIPVLGDVEFEPSIKYAAEMDKAYPAVNVMEQLMRMRAWCISNPVKRKTKRGVTKFINSWLQKQQNDGSAFQKPVQQQSSFDRYAP